MPELPPLPELVALGMVIFLAGMTNGATGMGFALLAAAGLALVVDLTTVVILLSVMVPPTSVMQLIRHRKDVEDAGKALPLIVTALIGVVIGVYLLKTLPSRFLIFALGTFTVLFVISSVRKFRLDLTPDQERWVGPLVGLTAGICSGSVGVSGPVLASYMLALDVPAATFAFTVSMLYGSMSLVRFAQLFAVGDVTWSRVALGLCLLVVGLIGQRFGFWIQSRFSRETFRRAVLLVLLVNGLQLMSRGVVGR